MMTTASKRVLACAAVVATVLPWMLSCGDDGGEVTKPPPATTYSWTTMNSTTGQDLRGIWGLSGSNVYVVGAGGTILHYDGTSWAGMTSPTGQDLIGIWGANNDTIYAVGADRTIATFNGTSWTASQYPATAGVPAGTNFYGIWGTAGDDVYVTSLSGAILHYDGSAWSEMNMDWDIYGPKALHGIWGTDSNHILACGLEGTILWCLDGANWDFRVKPDSITTNRLWAMDGTSWNDAFLVGQAGEMLWFGGVVVLNWKVIYGGGTGAPFYALYDVFGYEPGKYIAVERYGKIFRLNMIGGVGSWSAMTSPTTNALYAVWGSSGTDVFAVGFSGTIIHYAPE